MPLTSGPLWAVGCGWALQSAEWLVESTAEALVAHHDLAGRWRAIAAGTAPSSAAITS